MGFMTKRSGGGSFLPYIKYDARSGRFKSVSRFQDSNGDWDSEEEKVELPLRVCVDFTTLEVGYIDTKNSPPDFSKLVPYKEGADFPESPGGDYKDGFRVQVYNKKLGVRHWSSTAASVIGEMNRMYDEWAKNDEKDMVSVVEISDVTEVKTGKTTNYAPDMKTDEFIKRPQPFDDVAADLAEDEENKFDTRKAAKKEDKKPAKHVDPPQSSDSDNDDGEEF